MKLNKLKNNLFWLFQIGGWITYGVVTYFIYYFFTKFTFLEFRQLLIATVLIFILTSILRYIYKKKDYKSQSLLSLSLIVILCSIVTATIQFLGSTFLMIVFSGDRNYLKWLSQLEANKIVWSIIQYSIVIISWSGLYFLIKLWREWEIQKERTEKANLLAQGAQLQMLRYQINPHFLFNSLNSIRALINEDKKKAKAMITELSEFLRYSLISNNLSEVPLNNELEAITHYLAIEKKRYEDKLDVTFEIDPSAEDYPVLSFLIHPLVENAIKFGMQTSPMPLRISIKAEVEKDKLILFVNNTGSWVNGDNKNNLKNGTETGLENVRQRLENAFHGNYNFEIIKKADQVQIKIEINRKLEKSNAKAI